MLLGDLRILICKGFGFLLGLFYFFAGLFDVVAVVFEESLIIGR